MKATFILKDLSETFFKGNGGSIKGFLNLESNLARFRYLTSSTARDLQITCKVGHADSFRDKVELNQMLRSNPEPTFKLEPRRGYKLATFEFGTVNDNKPDKELELYEMRRSLI